jgi:hypothetical protein
MRPASETTCADLLGHRVAQAQGQMPPHNHFPVVRVGGGAFVKNDANETTTRKIT